MSDHGPLTIHDLTTLQIVAEAAERSSRVRWLTESGNIGEGTARSLGDERGYFLGANDDVRDAFLRVTSITGWEYFMPVTRVMEMVRAGEFALDS